MSFPSQSTVAAFHKSAIGASYGKPSEECDLNRNVVVLLVIKVEGNETIVDTVTVCGRAKIPPELCKARDKPTPLLRITVITSMRFGRLSSWKI